MCDWARLRGTSGHSGALKATKVCLRVLVALLIWGPVRLSAVRAPHAWHRTPWPDALRCCMCARACVMQPQTAPAHDANEGAAPAKRPLSERVSGRAPRCCGAAQSLLPQRYGARACAPPPRADRARAARAAAAAGSCAAVPLGTDKYALHVDRVRRVWRSWARAGGPVSERH